jgi:guanyl-specific ribonuclease Sa
MPGQAQGGGQHVHYRAIDAKLLRAQVTKVTQLGTWKTLAQRVKSGQIELGSCSGKRPPSKYECAFGFFARDEGKAYDVYQVKGANPEGSNAPLNKLGQAIADLAPSVRMNPGTKQAIEGGMLLGGFLLGIGSAARETFERVAAEFVRDAEEVVADGSKRVLARITSGSLSAEEEQAVVDTMTHVDRGTVPTGPTSKRWGTPFKNQDADLPGGTMANSPYKEYRVAPAPGTNGAGARRIVVDDATGDMFYTWTHYGDQVQVPYVRIPFVQVR